MSYGFQTNFGTIDVQEVAIVDEFGGHKVVGKLFRPVDATIGTPAPGVLGLHGYNNDKDVQRGTALELARAGFVVLVIDQIGHGDSEGSLTWYLQGADSAYKWLAGLSFVNGRNRFPSPAAKIIAFKVLFPKSFLLINFHKF